MNKISKIVISQNGVDTEYILGGAQQGTIDDEIVSNEQTWSSAKIKEELDKIDNSSSSELPTDIPILYFDGILPTSKDQGNYKGAAHLRGSIRDDCYATLKVQGNSSTAYNKKNFTITFYSDVACTTKKKIDFGWGPQSKYVMKANWIDITHSRNVVSARLWGDIVKSRTDYDTLPELLRTSPNQGAIDGFPIKFYGNNVYWGRYTMNIPKDAWMTNMDKTNTQHLILCGENYNEALFRAPARWDETDWTDELHDEVPADLLARFNELVSFVMNSSDDDFKAGIGNYIDLRSVFDYYVFGLLICNLDGFGKNHIWLSYDGNKFIASAYDMDSTFGLYWDGSQMLSATYARSSYEDMVSGRLGNLLYIRIVNNFTNELQATYNRLVDNNGPMSYVSVLNRFEDFINIAPQSLVQEDYASTTANGACVSIPSTSTNNIQQIRSWYSARLSYVKASLGVIADEDNIELPATFAEWIDRQFDGNSTKKSPINTTYNLFSSDAEWQTWTLQVHAKVTANTGGGQRTAVHCMDETGDPWPGFTMQIGGSSNISDTKLELRATDTSGSVTGIFVNSGAEQYFAIQREGDILRYSTDGKTWTTFSGTIYNHNSPLVLGGYCNGSGQVLAGANGREIEGFVTARLWKEKVDNVAKLFIEQFTEGPYTFDHTMEMMSYDQLEGMTSGQSVDVMMVNPQATSGYILGYNNGPQSVTGTTTLDATKQLLDQNYNDTYLMNIAKVTDTFRVSGKWYSSSFSKQTSSISGYTLYSTPGNIRSSSSKARTGTVTLTFSGNLPKTIYTKLYISNTNGIATATVNGNNITEASTDNTISSITNFTVYNINSVTGNTINISLNLAKISNATYTRFYILVPNDETYYTIKSKVGNYGPTGTTGVASWSTDLMRYQISNATTIEGPEDITTNINTENNPCMIRFTNPSGSFLNAGGSASALKYATGAGAWSVWNLWLIDEAAPSSVPIADLPITEESVVSGPEIDPEIDEELTEG